MVFLWLDLRLFSKCILPGKIAPDRSRVTWLKTQLKHKLFCSQFDSNAYIVEYAFFSHSIFFSSPSPPPPRDENSSEPNYFETSGHRIGTESLRLDRFTERTNPVGVRVPRFFFWFLSLIFSVVDFDRADKRPFLKALAVLLQHGGLYNKYAAACNILLNPKEFVVNVWKRTLATGTIIRRR